MRELPGMPRLPRVNISLEVAGGADARLEGPWVLDPGSRGALRNLTCLRVWDAMASHDPPDTFVVRVCGGPWRLDRVHLHAGCAPRGTRGRAPVLVSS
jgi:hypothetical protein